MCVANSTCAALVQSALPVGAMAWLLAENKVATQPSWADQIPTTSTPGIPLSQSTSTASPIDNSPNSSNNTGGTQLDQAQGPSHTGGYQLDEDIHSGNNAGGGYGAGTQPTVNPVVMSVDPRLPIKEPTVGTNGIPIESNGKHTPGLPGYNPSAGTEPRNSLDLFNQSIASPKDPTVRYSIDAQGNINRFSSDGNGRFHWSGSTGDASAPLNPNPIPIEIRRLPGVKK